MSMCTTVCCEFGPVRFIPIHNQIPGPAQSNAIRCDSVQHLFRAEGRGSCTTTSILRWRAFEDKDDYFLRCVEGGEEGGTMVVMCVDVQDFRLVPTRDATTCVGHLYGKATENVAPDPTKTQARHHRLTPLPRHLTSSVLKFRSPVQDASE